MLPLLPQATESVEEVFFKTLDDLIRHFKRRNQGLAVHLRHSVKRKTAMLSPPLKQPALRVSPDDQDQVYESTSHVPCWLQSCGFVLYLTVLCVPADVPNSSDYVKVLPPWATLTHCGELRMLCKGRQAHSLKQMEVQRNWTVQRLVFLLSPVFPSFSYFSCASGSRSRTCFNKHCQRLPASSHSAEMKPKHLRRERYHLGDVTGSQSESPAHPIANRAQLSIMSGE